jgi:hypothetical protein
VDECWRDSERERLKLREIEMKSELKRIGKSSEEVKRDRGD